MSATHPELSIRSEPIQRVYDYYVSRRFIVNRRYQRKLVWTIEEKQALIDSIMNGFPVPLFLLGDVEAEDERFFEIIDGMQRLDAICSFLENKYAASGSYFDLDTMAETKLLSDKGLLEQMEPRLSREVCARIASYVIPLSVYRFRSHGQVDEIFRRINSQGRQLSRQDLRQAGATGEFSDLVREVSARIRGDVSARENLPLNAMHKISITSKELGYGIDVDTMFWVEQNILTRDYVRKSRDEELVADLLAYVCLDEKPASSSEFIDSYFGLGKDGRENARYKELATALKKRGLEEVKAQFLRTHDALRAVLQNSGKRFNLLMFEGAGQRVPRYYQAVFLAVHKLLCDGLEVDDAALVAKKLDGIGNKFMNIGGGGGRWSAEERNKNIDAVAGLIKGAFKKAGPVDPAFASWTTQFENLLSLSITEQNCFDFKQGLFAIAGPPPPVDEGVLGKTAKTLSAMANAGPRETGYVLVGVANDAAAAAAVKATYGVTAVVFNGFHITGIEHEAKATHGDVDGYFQWVTQKLKSQPAAAALLDQVARDVRIVRYFDKAVLVFKVEGGGEPVVYDGKYYVRKGANVEEVLPEGMASLFKRFLA